MSRVTERPASREGGMSCGCIIVLLILAVLFGRSCCGPEPCKNDGLDETKPAIHETNPGKGETKTPDCETKPEFSGTAPCPPCGS